MCFNKIPKKRGKAVKRPPPIIQRNLRSFSTLEQIHSNEHLQECPTTNHHRHHHHYLMQRCHLLNMNCHVSKPTSTSANKFNCNTDYRISNPILVLIKPLLRRLLLLRLLLLRLGIWSFLDRYRRMWILWRRTLLK